MGAGTYAKAVYDAAVLSGVEVDGLAVSDTRCAGFNHLKVISEEEIVTGDSIILAIADNRIRMLLYNELKMIKAEVLTIIHPAAWISEDAKVGEGSVVLAGALINHSAVCGIGSSIGTGVIIESDCLVDHGVSIAAGAVICGAAGIGSETAVGARAVICPNVRIGSSCVIRPGETIVTNLADGTGLRR